MRIQCVDHVFVSAAGGGFRAHVASETALSSGIVLPCPNHSLPLGDFTVPVRYNFIRAAQRAVTAKLLCFALFHNHSFVVHIVIYMNSHK